jgi:5-methylcytosine-specific restriction endonuclease McrBC GTP-binding regulatory subunit McrB
MTFSVESNEKLWDDFLNRWPIESLQNLTLEHYSKAGDPDCFSFGWLEKRTEALGSIYGGSAFKFGVYSRRNKADKKPSSGREYSSDYGWGTKYGATAESAFENVRNIIVTVANAARQGDLETIENADLGPAVKWKIAFLYQDRTKPSLLAVFSKEHLRTYLEAGRKEKFNQLQSYAMSKRGDINLLEFGKQVWDQADSKLAALILKPEDALAYFEDNADRFESRKEPTKYIAGFITIDGSMIALEREGKKTKLWLEPGSWLQKVKNQLSDITEYPPEKTRNSNLGANAPKLAAGNPAVSIIVPTKAALIELTNIYGTFDEEENEGNQDSMMIDKHKDTISSPLNQILFGPPGTGKTYSTIDESLRILDLQFYEDHREKREVLKTRFDEFVTSGQIRFTTFHQSFSYEDFVEGLVATSSNGQIEYSVEPGIFKRLCEDAVGDQESITVDSALDSFIEQVSEAPITLTTATGKKFSVSYRYPNTTLTCLPESSQTKIELPANLEHIRQVLSGNRPPKIYCESYVKGVAEHIKKENPNLGKNIIPPKNSVKKPYVLVIDEINRGNISKIFGELITLIEPSKRAGKAEELSVQLPYSKRQFSVPANVFIIGTMNTADRSLTSLDIALRRRFSFREMPPKPDELKEVVIQGINIAVLLETMNKRIEALLDRDHRIGHAYFMPLKQAGKANLNELKSIFCQQILPLLKEYFFEDWERIGWVLNDQNKSEDSHKFIFKGSNNLNELFGNKVASSLQNIDQRWDLNQNAFDDINSYRLILGANQ